MIELASLSAIIPTKNRPVDLQLTIRTLLLQTLLPREIIVIDQSSDEDSYKVVQAEFREAGRRSSVLPALKYVHDPSIKGVSAARNHALTIASEAVWLFLDDDVILETNFIKELIYVYASSSEIDGVSGVITNYRPFPLLLRTWMRIFALGPFTEGRLPIYWQADKLRDAGLFRVKGFSGGLMSFRSQVARNGRFDTRIGDAEDVDFCLNLGGSRVLVIAPRARLRHMSSPVGRAQNLWLGKFAASQSFLYRKNWHGSFINRVCFAWLCMGLGVAATASGLRHVSVKPWQATIAGIRTGYRSAASRLLS